MEVLTLIGAIIIGYLIGSFPSAVFIGKVFFHIDVREKGSHNAGGTNAGRVLGKKVGLIVIILDVIKTLLPMWLTFFVITRTDLINYAWLPVTYYASGLGAVLGHTFPLFAGFRGGKAVSSFGGFVIGTNWLLALVGFVSFMLILKLKKYVSLASMIGSVITACFAFLPFLNYTMYFGMQFDISYSLSCVALAIYVIIRHRSNIQRLIKHEERKVTWL